MKRYRTIFASFLVTGLCASPAHAHKVKLFATVEGHTVSGYAYVAGEAPLREVPVRVLRAEDRNLITNVVTDADGRFSFQITTPGDQLLEIDLGDGHHAEWLLKGEDSPSPPLPSTEPEPDAERRSSPSADDMGIRALQRQVRDLAEQLERHESKIRLQDVVGGVGYLVGLAGVAFYLLTLRKRP